MVNLLQPQVTDTWTPANWSDYVALVDDPKHDRDRGYYDAGWMKIEMSALEPFHARENSVISNVVSLFATLNNIRIVELTNGTIRKPGLREGQPDIAFYIGEAFQLPPQDNQPLNVDVYGVPQLVIEISATSLSDDLGNKRLLYERFGVTEYWIVDLVQFRVIAFEIADGRSGEISDNPRVSKVLPGLELAVVEAALRRSQTEDDGAINRWLIGKFTVEVVL